MIATQQTEDSGIEANVSVEELAYVKAVLARYVAKNQTGFGVQEIGAAPYQTNNASLAAKILERLKQPKPDAKAKLASGFASFNLSPETSVEALLENVGYRYPASSAEALGKDWQAVGSDLWQSWAKANGSNE